MRVIAGNYRSRLLVAPHGVDTRPTSDRLRETLFNVLAPRIEGAVFADLYAGSGAVGIEAISRGASLVYLVEQAASALTAIRENLDKLAIRSGYQLEARTVSAFLRRLLTQKSLLDIVFLDPPYESAKEYDATLGYLGRDGASSLNPGAIVIAEHRRKQSLAGQYGGLARYRVLEQGDAALSFYRSGNETRA